MSQLKSAKLLELINDVFDFNRLDLGVENKDFSRSRVLSLKVMIFSLLLAAQGEFKQGYGCVMAELFLMGLVKKKRALKLTAKHWIKYLKQPCPNLFP